MNFLVSGLSPFWDSDGAVPSVMQECTQAPAQSGSELYQQTLPQSIFL